MKANASKNGEPVHRSPLKKGNEVIFTSYAGTEIKLDGEEIMIMSEDDVLARCRMIDPRRMFECETQNKDKSLWVWKEISSLGSMHN